MIPYCRQHCTLYDTLYSQKKQMLPSFRDMFHFLFRDLDPHPTTVLGREEDEAMRVELEYHDGLIGLPTTGRAIGGTKQFRSSQFQRELETHSQKVVKCHSLLSTIANDYLQVYQTHPSNA